MIKFIETVVKFLMREYNPKSTLAIDIDLSSRLREIVEHVSFERDMFRNPVALNKTRSYIKSEFESNCNFCELQGGYQNVIGYWEITDMSKVTVIGGHFDGPPGSPGADDNGSAIACLVALAEQFKKHKPKNVILAAFNGEEHGFLGSKEFVEQYRVKQAVVFEMVGFYSKALGSQTMPVGFPPISIGDFLAIVGNSSSKNIGKKLVQQARQCKLNLPIKEIKIPFGLEKIESLSHVCRSDHSPFWDKGIPAVMLTDTAEFRNKNYHTKHDIPDTLNYDCMAEVVRLIKDWTLSV